MRLANQAIQAGISASIVAAFLLLLALAASAQTVTRGPYLQRGNDTAITVRWRTSTATESTVLYGSEPGNLSLSATSATPATEHAMTLSPLLPETRYYYAISVGGSIIAGADLSTYFETSPVTGSTTATRIWVIGDSGTADANATDVYDAYRGLTGNLYTDLWLMLGDNAYNDGTDSEYQLAVFDVYPELLAQTPLWPTLGNHDGHTADSTTESGPYYDIFELPRAAEVGGTASGTEAYYSFEYANIHFVVLDSYETDRSLAGAMLTWLEDDLQDAVATGTTDWLIAFWHHPPYSKGSHDSDSDSELVDMRTNALPLLETYGVDLVLTGHSHSYERSFLIDGHYDLSGTFGPSHTVDGGDGRPTGTGAYEKATAGHGASEGAVYVVAGSSGKISGGALDHPAMFISLNELGSLVLDVNGAELNATFIDETATIRDSFMIQKGPAPTTSSISGRVWHDVDADGVREVGEADLSGIPIELKLGSGVPAASTTTDGSGAYTFSGLNAGSFRVEVGPGARIFTAAGEGADPTRDSDFDAATGVLALVLAEGEARSDLDAGLLDASALGGAIVDLSDIAVQPYAGLDTGFGTAESRSGGTTYYTLGTRWVQTVATFDIDPTTVVSFDFQSSSPGFPSAVGFDDDGDPTTGIRLFDLGNSDALGTHAIPQSYEGAGGWQTYRIPVGAFFTGTGLHLVLGVTTPATTTEYGYVQSEFVMVDGIPTATVYTGTHDAELRQDTPASNYDLGTGSTNPEFTIDLDDPGGSGNEVQVVMRFDSIFGEASWQIPPGLQIDDASLFIDIDNTGSDLALYEMTTGFGAETSVTWNSVGGGVDAATQTTNSPISIPGDGNNVFVDVTATMQAWSDGTTNHGWAFRSTGIDGVDFDASENSDPADRPALTVISSEQSLGNAAETEIRNVQVPEPGARLGLVTGIGLLALLLRRRRSKARVMASIVASAGLLSLVETQAAAHVEPGEHVAELTSAIARAEDKAPLLVEGGRLWLQARRFEMAVSDFERAIEIAPRSAPAYYYAAEALTELARFDEALVRIREFRARVYDNPAALTRALRLRARTHAAAGDLEEAARDWERFITQAGQPSPDDFLEWSTSLASNKPAALAALEVGLARLGPLASLERRAYAIEIESGLYTEASARAERWLSQRRGNVFLLPYLAEAYRHLGRDAETREIWRRIIAATEDLPAYRRAPAFLELEARARRALTE